MWVLIKLIRISESDDVCIRAGIDDGWKKGQLKETARGEVEGGERATRAKHFRGGIQKYIHGSQEPVPTHVI